MEQASYDDLEILTKIISLLKKLTKEDQLRTLQSVATFLDVSFQDVPHVSDLRPTATIVSNFSEDRAISSKNFLLDKDPRSDVARVACLAYYLTHYRDTPHFKTLDISALNTEAAQPKFSNASVAVDNATKAGLLVQATKGNKQISAAGERYVQLLPDQDAAKSSIQGARPKRKPRRFFKANNNESKQDEK